MNSYNKPTNIIEFTIGIPWTALLVITSKFHHLSHLHYKASYSKTAASKAYYRNCVIELHSSLCSTCCKINRSKSMFAFSCGPYVCIVFCVFSCFFVCLQLPHASFWTLQHVPNTKNMHIAWHKNAAPGELSFYM